jgi:hypothetical protein
MAWAQQVGDMCQHAETAQTPIERFRGHGPLHAVEPSLPREAFMRRVTQTSSVSLAGNRYFVDQAIAGRRVELRFDPDDLTRMDVYWEGYPLARRSHSSSDGMCTAKCRKLNRRRQCRRPASITSAWYWRRITSCTWPIRRLNDVCGGTQADLELKF